LFVKTEATVSDIDFTSSFLAALNFTDYIPSVKSNTLRGCLTVLGVSAWNHAVSFFRIEHPSNGGFQVGKRGVRPSGKFFPKSGSSCGQLIKCSQRVAPQGTDIQASRGLVQTPESFRIISIELKKLTKEPLRDFRSRQVHAIQSTE